MTTKTCPEVQYKLWNAYNNVKHEHNFIRFIFKTYSEINIFNFGIEKSGLNILAFWNRSEIILYAKFTYIYVCISIIIYNIKKWD